MYSFEYVWFQVMQLQCGRKHNVRAETVYDFQVPVGKVRDVTVVVVSDEGRAAAPSASTATEGSQSQVQHVQAKYTLLIMSSNGHIYMQSLGETNTFALGGTFFATDTLELKHPEIKVLSSFMSLDCIELTRPVAPVRSCSVNFTPYIHFKYQCV